MRRLVACLLALPLVLVSPPVHAESSATTQLIIAQVHPSEGARLARIPVSGGDGTSFLDDGLLHPDVAVSPNGQWVAYTSASPDDPTHRRSLMMRRTDGTGSPVFLESTPLDVYAPAWSYDGRAMTYTIDDGGPVICAVTVSSGGASPCHVVSVVSDHRDDHASFRRDYYVVADQGAASGPSAPLVELPYRPYASFRFEIAGTEGGIWPSVSPDGAQIAYLVPDATGSAQAIRLYDYGSKTVQTLPTPGGQTFSAVSWTRDMTAVYVVGTSSTATTIYRVSTEPGGSFTAVPTSGQQSNVATITEDLTPPTDVTLSGVPALTLVRVFTMHASATDALNKIAFFDLSYRRSSGGAYNGWYTGGWGDGKGQWVMDPGYSYCFATAATDLAANRSPSTTPQCVMMPLDDPYLHRSAGWQRVNSKALYGGTAAAGEYGATLTRAGYTDIRQVSIVAQACPTCGILDVLVGGVKVGSINTISSTVVNRKVYSVAFSTRSGTVMLRVAGHRRVMVDGLGFRK